MASSLSLPSAVASSTAFVFTSVMRAPHEQIQLLTDMVSSQMRESLALNNGCTLAAYPCRSAAVRRIRARVVSFNDIHRSDHAFVVAAMYSASVGIGGRRARSSHN